MVRHRPSNKSGNLCYEQVGVVIGSASCFLSPRILVSQCEAVTRLTSIYNGELPHFFIGLFQKKSKKGGGEGVDDMEFPELLKEQQ